MKNSNGPGKNPSAHHTTDIIGDLQVFIATDIVLCDTIYVKIFPPQQVAVHTELVFVQNSFVINFVERF